MYSLERILNQIPLPFKRRPSGLEALAINYTISQVASGMLVMFGVLFIYELGESFNKGLLMVLGFFGLQRIVVGLVVPLVAKLISKTGYRWMMLIGLISLALKAWFLMQVGQYSLWLLAPAMILGGVAIASYYQGYYGIFLDDNDDDRIGEQMGLMTMVGRMALIISPLLAGFLVDEYGFSVMFGVAMSLLIISLGPLFLMQHHEHKASSFSTKAVVKLFKKKKGFTASVFWWNIESGIQAFYWPIFLFLVVGSHIKFGAIASIVMIFNSLAVYVSGKIYDKRPLRRGYPMATGVVMVSYILRFSAFSLLMVGAADSLNRIASPFWWMKIRRRALLIGEKVRVTVFAATWEWAVTAGYLVSLIIGFFILRLTGGKWIWLAAPAIIGVLMSAILVRKNEK